MKNLKSLITNSFSIVFGILIYVFLSQNFFTYSVNISGNPTSGASTGYQLIRNLFEGGDSTPASLAMVVSLFIISILAGLMIICSVYSLLRNFNVIKYENEKLDKTISIINFVLGVLIAIFAIVAISCTSAYLKNGLDMTIATTTAESLTAAGMPNVTAEIVLANLMTDYTANIAWANVVNLIMSILTAVSTSLTFVFDRKSNN